MRKVIVTFVLVLCFGCQQVAKYDKLDKPSVDALDSLSTSNNFAFSVDGSSYAFAPVELQENDYRCNYFVGYKNGKLSYKFLAVKLKQLENIYASKMDIKTKMQRALKEIDQLVLQDNSCNSQSGRKYNQSKQVLDDTFNVVFYSPLIMVGVMIYVGTGMVIQDLRDKAFDANLRDVLLGMTSQQVNSQLGEDIKIRKSGPYEVQEYRREPRASGMARELVFIYEKSKLIAYVWGYGKKAN